MRKQQDFFQPFFIDNFGDGYYKCHYSEDINHVDLCAVVGSVMPGVNQKKVISKTQINRHKESGRMFAESEQNCNTCKYLKRIKHEKRRDGFLPGECKNKNGHIELSPYTKNGALLFHPDDPMHMPCYESRWQHA